MSSAADREGMRVIDTDVLVVGSGLAGVMAAMKAARMGCKVLLTSKVSMMSGNSIFAGGGFLAPSGSLRHGTREDFVVFTASISSTVFSTGIESAPYMSPRPKISSILFPLSTSPLVISCL